ncbi:MAG: RdgB/HAM1 family non-canonical purine NTP pyrophosphatase [Tatlockia sp.]|nr:RdgB/HAM1 family non-canonical purine NTP pyrophosphatase [Tatlockia sp.]
MKDLILATSNHGKIAELKSILGSINCISQSKLGISDAEETGLSFVENALLKARHASRLTNKPALADDSGLVVQALNGAPGLYSARFAGQNSTDDDNIELLLKKLEGIPSSKRQAYFYCAIVVLTHPEDPTPLIATGKWCGSIIDKKIGQQGFGYDPIFYVHEHQCTAAELSPDIKNTISHRSLALQNLRYQLEDFLKR